VAVRILNDQKYAAETFKETLLRSMRSVGFWGAISAVVGIIAVAAGGVLFLTVEETRNFNISVVVIGAVMLLLALILNPRAIAMFLIGRQGRFGTNTLIMTVAFFSILVLINFLVFRLSTTNSDQIRLDLTATRVFTLAPQSQQVLETLNTTVRANAFFVPTDSRTESLRVQVEDLLNEFSRRTNNFEFRFIDPEFNRTLALQYDVTDFPVVVFEDKSIGTIQSTTTFSEQGFVTGILISTGARQKLVYFLTGHRESSETRDPFTQAIDDDGFDLALAGMQRDNYRTLPLNLKQEGRVPADADVLVIAGPQRDLDDDEQSALFDYIIGGGATVMLLDPGTPRSFLELISQWGITLGGISIADAASNVGGELLTPLVQRTNGQFFSSENTGIGIVDKLDVAFFPEVTSVDLLLTLEDMPSFITFSPLVFSTPASWLESDPDNISFGPDEDARGPFTIAGVIQAFGTLTGGARATPNSIPSKIVVIGDSDFAKNKFFFSNDNSDLLLNSVNWLAEDVDLISIRPKVVPFRELIINTREKDFIKWSSWLVPPSIMVLLGVLVWWRRR